MRTVRGEVKFPSASEAMEHTKALQADEIPTPCRKAGRARLNSTVRAGLEHKLLSPGSETDSAPGSPRAALATHAPPAPAATGAQDLADAALSAPFSAPTARESSTPSTAPATPTASPAGPTTPKGSDMRDPAPARTEHATRVPEALPEAEGSQCSEILEPLAAPVDNLTDLTAPAAVLVANACDSPDSPDLHLPSKDSTSKALEHFGEEADEHTETEEEEGEELQTSAAAIQENLSQFCLAKTTQEEARRRSEACVSATPPASGAQDAEQRAPSPPIDLSQFAFAKTTQEELLHAGRVLSQSKTPEPAASAEACSRFD